ncbi:MAG: radical SAM protein, partial [Lachnospiraceae bacterium]|nr:radical SAM protein [Lachnospiraceae bacterium]
MRKDIKSMPLEELSGEMDAMRERRYRAAQLYDWMHVKLARSFSEMTNLSAELREKLQENYVYTSLELLRIQESEKDQTKKFLFRLQDKNLVETVWMKHRHGNSVCVSSQVGCRMGCRFCASTLGGLERNLSPSEILDQVYAVTLLTGERVSNVVVMGTGEPLDNFDSLVRFIRLL